jgi:hypothetical protein
MRALLLRHHEEPPASLVQRGGVWQSPQSGRIPQAAAENQQNEGQATSQFLIMLPLTAAAEG